MPCGEVSAIILDMVQITIPKTEYKRLKEIAKRYETIQDLVKEDFFALPPTRSAKEIIREMRKTKKYEGAFLKSLEHGLEESSYFRK